MDRCKLSIKTAAALLLSLFLLNACSGQQPSVKDSDRLIKESIPRPAPWKAETPDPSAPLMETLPPPFVSVTEDIVPLKTKIVNIVVRNSPLGDVLHVMAEASGLNLLIDREVALDTPVTLSIKNAPAEEALKIIFSSVDYFYSINNNVLKVESVGTRVFELGHPALVNTYSMDVGGDILSASGGGGLKGTISSGSKADNKAFDFWDAMEKNLENILKKDASSLRNQPQQSITINRLTGTIMLTASRRNMEKVERYLDNVKKVMNRQVMIEARIIEVQLNEGVKFGIDWSYLENFKALGGPLNAGFGALNTATTSLKDATADAASASKFQVGLSRGDFQGLLTAIKTQGDITILSNPKINVMNGHASILTVGTNTSFISKVTTTTTATAAGNSISFAPETTSVLSGMIIGIVPYISEKGEISLNITPITSDLTNLQDRTFGSAGNQLTITIPTIALREMTTTVKMRDGQIVIIGGLISRKGATNEEKVPLLGDVPVLGKLFSRTNNTESRSELVLLLRPHIVDND